jgi:hypothetical protein
MKENIVHMRRNSNLYKRESKEPKRPYQEDSKVSGSSERWKSKEET